MADWQHFGTPSGQPLHPAESCSRRGSLTPVSDPIPWERSRERIPWERSRKGEARYALLPTEDVQVDSEQHSTVEERGSWRTQIAHLLEGRSFQFAMALMIVANAVTIGLETDLPDAAPWELIENIFLSCFVLEMAVKISVVGARALFKGPERVGNMADLFTVCFGVTEVGCGMIMGPGHKKRGGLALLVRVIRLIRILRLLRIIRFFSQLYLLAFGFIEAAKAVVWVTILLGFGLFVLSIVLVHTLGRSDQSDEYAVFFAGKYGSVVMSMWSLFSLMASPDLEDIGNMDGMLIHYPLYGLFLVTFVFFGSFGMVALLTGVISESMLEKNQLRISMNRRESEKRFHALARRCIEMMNSLRPGEDVPLSAAMEFAPQLREELEAEGLDFTDQEICNMFRVMDSDHSGSLDKDEIDNAISALVSGLRTVPLQEIAYEVSWCKIGIGKIEKVLKDLSDKAEGFLSSQGPPSCTEFREQGQQLRGDEHTSVTQTPSKVDIPSNESSPEPKIDKLATDVEKLANSIENIVQAYRHAEHLYCAAAVRELKELRAEMQTFWQQQISARAEQGSLRGNHSSDHSELEVLCRKPLICHDSADRLADNTLRYQGSCEPMVEEEPRPSEAHSSWCGEGRNTLQSNSGSTGASVQSMPEANRLDMESSRPAHATAN